MICLACHGYIFIYKYFCGTQWNEKCKQRNAHNMFFGLLLFFIWWGSQFTWVLCSIWKKRQTQRLLKWKIKPPSSSQSSNSSLFSICFLYLASIKLYAQANKGNLMITNHCLFTQCFSTECNTKDSYILHIFSVIAKLNSLFAYVFAKFMVLS